MVKNGKEIKEASAGVTLVHFARRICCCCSGLGNAAHVAESQIFGATVTFVIFSVQGGLVYFIPVAPSPHFTVHEVILMVLWSAMLHLGVFLVRV